MRDVLIPFLDASVLLRVLQLSSLQLASAVLMPDFRILAMHVEPIFIVLDTCLKAGRNGIPVEGSLGRLLQGILRTQKQNYAGYGLFPQWSTAISSHISARMMPFLLNTQMSSLYSVPTLLVKHVTALAYRVVSSGNQGLTVPKACTCVQFAYS